MPLDAGSSIEQIFEKHEDPTQPKADAQYSRNDLDVKSRRLRIVQGATERVVEVPANMVVEVHRRLRGVRTCDGCRVIDGDPGDPGAV